MIGSHLTFESKAIQGIVEHISKHCMSYFSAKSTKSHSETELDVSQLNKKRELDVGKTTILKVINIKISDYSGGSNFRENSKVATHLK